MSWAGDLKFVLLAIVIAVAWMVPLSAQHPEAQSQSAALIAPHVVVSPLEG